jgi:hypothetical protein
MYYSFGTKHPYRGHQYVLQNVLILQANVDSSVNMTVSHLRSILLSANAKRYSLSSSVRSYFTAACRALRLAALSLEMILSFCPGKPVAALRSLVLKKRFLSASATNAVSWAGLETRHNPVPLRLPTYRSQRYFLSHFLAVDMRTP